MFSFIWRTAKNTAFIQFIANSVGVNKQKNIFAPPNTIHQGSFMHGIKAFLIKWF